ncbi:MAG: nucleoside transporter C-terminal domain-containing protein [Pseudomonadota bacterium]
MDLFSDLHIGQLQSALGLIGFPLLAWVCSRNHEKPNFRLWFSAIALQIVLALLLLKLPWFQTLFAGMNQGVLAIERAASAGTSFVFGYLGGADLPFETTNPASSYILAFRALPLILVIGALTGLLSYWRVLPWIIEQLSRLFTRSLGIGGAVALSGAANIFVGMTEAPLFIRRSMSKLSVSELLMVMTLGMSTVAGTVLVLYATFLAEVIPNAIGHIFTASIISIPASVLISLIFIPQTTDPTPSEAEVAFDYHGPMDAIAQGGINAMQMLLAIIALLVTFIALVSLSNDLLGLLPEVFGSPLTLERMLGWIMAPICWLMGIPWSEATTAGGLMGIKTVLNELIAFIQLGQLPEEALSPRSELILSYALCGFANFGSLGILIGGLSTLAPERRHEIARLGLLSIVSGTLATCMTASVIGVLH